MPRTSGFILCLTIVTIACAQARPQGPTSARIEIWDAGAALLDAGRNAEAASHFERELAASPASLELAEGLIEARSRLCTPDAALAYCGRMLAGLADEPRSLFDSFLAGAKERRLRSFTESAPYFRRAAALAEAAGDSLAAAVSARALAISALANQDIATALEAAAAYRRFAAGSGSDRLAADALAVEAECHSAADRIARADSLYRAALAIAREREWRRIESFSIAGLGRLDDKRQRNAEALEHYRSALSLERAMGDTEKIAVLLNGVGQIEVRTGALKAAAARFAEAETIAVACDLEWILGYLYYGYGAVAESRGERGEALRIFHRSLALHRESGDRWGELGAHLRLGYLRINLGEYARAIGHYESALAYYDRIESLYGRSWALAGLAVSYHRLGDFKKAAEFYHRTLEVKRELGDRKGAAWALNALGMIADVQGRYRDALAFESEAMAIYEELGDRGGMGDVRFSMGSVYYYVGNYTEALEHYEQAFTIATELDYRELLERVVSGMGSVYTAAGRPDLARPFYERCLALKRRSGDRSGVVWALNNLASLEVQLGAQAAARTLVEEALRLLPQAGQNHLRARALYLLAKTEPADRAVDVLHRALAFAEETSLEELKWRCLSDLGELHFAMGDTAQAYLYQHRAVVSVESLRRLAGSDELRRHFLEPAILPYERIVNLILTRSGAENDVKEALSYTERSRAQNLAALLRQAMGRARPRGNERILGEERDILSRLTFYQARLQSGALSDAERADFMKRIEALERRFVKLSLEFEKGERPYSEALYPRIEQPDELLSALVPGERMLSYFLGERRSYLFSAADGKIDVYPLPPRAKIEERVGRFLGLLQQIAEGSAEPDDPETPPIPSLPAEVLEFASGELSDIILGPVAAKLAANEKLVIIPDGPLNRLPFAMLRTDGRYLVEEHELSFAPSLRTLRYLRQRSGMRSRSVHRPKHHMIAVGASGGMEESSDEAPRVYPFTDIPIKPLDEAEDEARIVGSLFARSLVLTGLRARESAFKESPLYDTGMLHLAAHAYIDDADLRRSFIVLNPDETFEGAFAGRTDDGLLQWHEAAALKLNASLVTLSSCRSAGGVLANGEGITGFAQAFLYAGAGCVIASQLDVPDRIATPMMEAFYRRIRRGKDAASALAAAQRAYIERGDALSDPVVWGSFCALGDGTAAPRLSAGPGAGGYLAIGLLIAACAAILWNALRRRGTI